MTRAQTLHMLLEGREVVSIGQLDDATVAFLREAVLRRLVDRYTSHRYPNQKTAYALSALADAPALRALATELDK